MKRIAFAILVIAGVIIGVAITAVAASNTISTSMGDQPDLTPQLTIRSPTGVIKAGEPISVVVEYVNFHADPAARCAPAGTCLGSLPNRVTEGVPSVDVGHIHVYFTPAVESVEGPVQATSFCIPSVVAEVNFAGTVSGNCPALTEKGEYRVSAEFQSDSHVSSLKAFNSPQHIPTSDVEIIRVTP
jgi:hypothetical protein